MTILKILGFILLGIVGLVLLVLLILFIAPVAYRFAGGLQETAYFEGKVWWLFHLIEVVFRADNEKTGFEFRVFGKNRIRAEEEKNEKNEESAREENPENGSEKAEAGPEENHESSAEAGGQGDGENDDSGSESDAGPLGGSDDSRSGGGFPARFKRIKKLVTDEKTKKAVSYALRKLKAVLRHISPNKAFGRIHFGFDSPADTGIALSYIAAFLPKHKNAVSVEPDFIHECLDGNLACQGRINVGVLGVIALSVVLNPDVQKTYKRFKVLQKLNEEDEK